MNAFHAVVWENPEGGYTAQCAEIPGAISQGETREEALKNLSDAVQMILDVRREKGLKQAQQVRGRYEAVELNVA